ncbi:Hypothetical protein A7982_09117 [Minicystis rosea]|nr:Hypothetical protein A7982_09117 [Minicystis rosea]
MSDAPAYRGSAGSDAGGASESSASSLPASSSAERSLKPPTDFPLMNTCGTVRWPVVETSHLRRSCRSSTSISVKRTFFSPSRSLAARQ